MDEVGFGDRRHDGGVLMRCDRGRCGRCGRFDEHRWQAIVCAIFKTPLRNGLPVMLVVLESK